MGRKKIEIGGPVKNQVELKPFCYYCEKEFDTIKTLITHQRGRHFNCQECGAKFDTVTGLRVHMLNAYKKTMKEVPNCIPGRENPDIVVHGMEGLPKGILEEKTAAAMAERDSQHQERAAETKERLKVLAAQRAERGEPEEEEAPPPPEPPSIFKMSVVPKAVQQQAFAPAQPAASSRSRQQPQMMYAAPAAPAEPMPTLSPAVMALLSGGANSAAGGMEEVTTVPGLRGHLVPSALAGLHSVALHVLASAGVLLPAPPGGGEPDQKRMRTGGAVLM